MPPKRGMLGLWVYYPDHLVVGGRRAKCCLGAGASLCSLPAALCRLTRRCAWPASPASSAAVSFWRVGNSNPRSVVQTLSLMPAPSGSGQGLAGGDAPGERPGPPAYALASATGTVEKHWLCAH